MKNGISTNQNVGAQAACLKKEGLDFVFRYYSTTTRQPEKRLTQPEASAILAAGLAIGVVYEDLPTVGSYFSAARGQLDGRNALKAALELNQPPGSAIYFAVDYDAPPLDVAGPILDYFNGVNQGLQDATGGATLYSVGVYGSGAVCDSVKAQCGFVKYSWLSESTGWRGSNTYTSWDVKQSIPTVDLCGFTAQPPGYEKNLALDDFGGFVTFGPPPAKVTT